jgi:hypothetical protein
MEPRDVICSECGNAIRSKRELVRLNDSPLHVEACFKKALTALRRPGDFFSVDVGAAVPAEIAFTLGLQTGRILYSLDARARRRKGAL